MNKIFKRFLVCTLALLMVINPLGACFATGTPSSGGVGGGAVGGGGSTLNPEYCGFTISIDEQDGGVYEDASFAADSEGLKKLVFTVTDTKSLGKISNVTIPFSYDSSVIQPMYADLEITTDDVESVVFDYSTADDNTACFAPHKSFSAVPNWVDLGNNRVGVEISLGDTSKTVNAANGAVVGSFYFKYKDVSKANAETFMLEIDSTDGLLEAIYPTPSGRKGLVVMYKDAEGEFVEKYFSDGVAVPSTIEPPTLTYTNSDKLVLKEAKIDKSTIDSITAPVVYPKAGADVTRTFSATATSTTGIDMTNEVTFSWALDGEYSDKIVLDGNVLTVKAGAEATKVTVVLKVGDKQYDYVDFDIKREDKPNYVVIYEGTKEIKESHSAIAPLNEGDAPNTYTFTAESWNAYGEEIKDETFEYVLTGTGNIGLTLTAGGVLTVEYGAEAAADAKITVTGDKGSTKEISLTVSTLDVNWTPVESKIPTSVVYGTKNYKILGLESATATIDGQGKIGETIYDGKFTVADTADGKPQNAGSGSIDVTFTTTVNGKEVSVTENYAVTITPLILTVTAGNQTEKYNNVKYDYNGNNIKLPEELEYKGATYSKDVAGTYTDANTDAGEYFVKLNIAFKDGYVSTNYTLDIPTPKLIIEPKALTYAPSAMSKPYNNGNQIQYIPDVNPPAELGISEIKYFNTEVNDYIVTGPSEVGTYNVKLYLSLEDGLNANNYTFDEEIDTTLTVTKAKGTKVEEVAKATKTAYEVKDLGSVTAIKDTLLPKLLKVYYNGTTLETEPQPTEYFADATVTWATTDAYNAKGTTYTFTGTLESALVDTTGLTATAVVEITPSTGEITVQMANQDAVFGNVKYAKNDVLDIASMQDIFEYVSVLINGADFATINWGAEDALWSKTIAEIKAAADKVLTDADEENVEIAISTDVIENRLPWLTFNKVPSATLTITNKLPVKVIIESQANGNYGEALAAPVVKQEADGFGTDENATFAYSYKGTTLGGVAYDSNVAPTEAGSYTVTASLVSSTHSDISNTVEFEIAPKAVTYAIDALTKAYGDEFGTPTGKLAEGSALVGDDDLGVKFDEITLDKFTAAGTQGLKVTATYTNKNYVVTFTGGEITITKKDISDLAAPVIIGDAEFNATIHAELEADIDDEIEYIWTVDGAEKQIGPNFVVYTDYSNKKIAVKAKAKDINYTGATKESEAIQLPKYAAQGMVKVETLTDEDGTLNKDDVLGANLAGIDVNVAKEDVKFEWTAGGNVVGEAAELTITDEMTGEVKVTVSLVDEADYTGSWTASAGVIGKTQLAKLVDAVAVEIVKVDGKETEIKAIITPDTLTDEEKANFEIKWFREGVEIAGAAGEKYTITEADYGKKIVAKAIAKGDIYTGEVVAAGDVVSPIAPEITNVKVTTAKDSITLEVTAKENGAPIQFVDIEYTEVVAEGEEVSNKGAVSIKKQDGKFIFVLDELTEGETYKFTIIATNEAGESAAVVKEAKAVASTTNNVVNEGGKKPSANKPSTPAPTPSTSTEATVESSKPSATVNATQLAGKETVAATVKTETGTEVKMEADVKDANIASLTVEAAKAEVEVKEEAKEAIVEVIEVKVEATDASKNAVDVKVDVAIPSEEKAYAYEVDAFGNLVRVDSEYDAEAGEVKVSGVADGTVLAVSKTEPKAFADTQGRWSEGEINKAADRGIVNGKGDGFDPAGNLTRHESNVLYKNLVDSVKATLEKKADAKVDTHEEHWGYDSDVWAVEVGISTGVGINEDGEVIMNGAANITRQDYATLAVRVLGLVIGEVKVEGEAKTFVDGDAVPEYAKEAVTILSSLGIINGSEVDGGFKFNGSANITREEAAAISNRLYEFVAKVVAK